MQKKFFINTLCSFQSVLNRGRRVRCQPIAKTVRKENHDGRIQRRAVVKTLQPICSFEAENFKVRKDRRLGSGSFGDVYACSLGCMGKIQCVIKIAKEGGEEDLLLECRILKKLLEEPSDRTQKFFAHAYGYNRNEKDLVLDRFLDYQYASMLKNKCRTTGFSGYWKSVRLSSLCIPGMFCTSICIPAMYWHQKNWKRLSILEKRF